MDVILREMTIDDYPASMQLWQETQGIGLSGADSPEKMGAFLLRNPGLSFVAINQERLVGTALCGHDGRRGYIYHMAVGMSYRRQGIGQKLLDRCLAGLKAEGIQKCHIMVLADNLEGLAFWQKSGWSQRDDILLMSHPV